jgi:hypothetical protein
MKAKNGYLQCYDNVNVIIVNIMKNQVVGLNSEWKKYNLK